MLLSLVFDFQSENRKTQRVALETNNYDTGEPYKRSCIYNSTEKTLSLSIFKFGVFFMDMSDQTEFIKKVRMLININIIDVNIYYKDPKAIKDFWSQILTSFTTKLGNVNGTSIFQLVREEYDNEYKQNGEITYRDFIDGDISGYVYDIKLLYIGIPLMVKDDSQYISLQSNAASNFVIGVNEGKPLIAVRTNDGTWKIRKQQDVISGLSNIKHMVEVPVDKGETKIVQMTTWNIVWSSIPVNDGVGFYAGDVPMGHFNCMSSPQPTLNGTILYHQGKLYNINDIPKYDFEGDNPTFDDLRPYIESYIQPVLNHIFWVFCNSNNNSYYWILAWMSFSITFPGIKPGVALIIRSELQGAGKGLFWHWMCNNVFGYHNSFFTADPANLGIGYTHNSLMEGNILAVLDELDKNGVIWSKMKSLMSLITEPYTVVNPKGLDQRKISSFTHLVMLCNDKTPVKIPDDDRRFAFFDCSSNFVGNREYFESLTKSMDPMMGAFFAYYLHNIWSNYSHIDVRKPPETEMRKEVIENSKSSVYKFLRDIATGEFPTSSIDGNYQAVNFTLEDNIETKVHTWELFEIFKIWSKITAEYGTYTQTNFSRNVCKELNMSSIQMWKNGSNRQGWMLSKDQIKTILNIITPNINIVE